MHIVVLFPVLVNDIQSPRKKGLDSQQMLARVESGRLHNLL